MDRGLVAVRSGYRAFYRIFTASRLGVGGGPWDWMGGQGRENLDNWGCLG